MKKRILAAVGVLSAAGAVGGSRVVGELRRRHRGRVEWLESNSLIAETSRGPVEYASVGEGPAILVAHGGGGGYDHGLNLVQRLDVPGFRFVAISRPGYLRTPLRVGSSPEEQADACLALMDALGIERAAMVGGSAGGVCALQFALRHPDRCWALILVSACTKPANFQPGPLYAALKALSTSGVALEAARALAESTIGFSARRSISSRAMRARVLKDPKAGPLLRETVLGAYCEPGRRFAGYDNDLEQIRSMPEYPIHQITAPTLVIHGTDDRSVPFAHAEYAANSIPGAVLVSVRGGEHVCSISHRDVIRPWLIGFLEAHAPIGSQPDPVEW